MRLNKNYIHYVIALVIGLVLLFSLQPTNGLTEVGVRVIAVLIPTLYLWLTTNTHWTCFLTLALLVMTQAMTPNQVWAESMGHFVVITVISYMLLNVALSETGVIKRIAMWFVTRKFVQGRPYAFMAMFFGSNVLIGLFMDNISLAIIYIALTGELCKTMGLQKGDSFYTCMYTGVMWGNVILSIASPIAHALPNIVMGLCETQLGITITYAEWLMVGVPFSVVMWVVIMIGVLLWKPDTTAFKNFNVEEVKRSLPPLDIRGKISAAVFVIVVLVVLMPSLLINVFPVVMGYLSAIGVAVPAMLAVAVLGIIHIKKEPILNVPQAMRTLPWPAIIFAGTVSVYATPLSSEVTGITTWMSNVFHPLVADLPDFGIIVVLMIIAIIFTNFLSNTVTMVLFFNIGAVLLVAGNTNMAAFTIIIALASSMATLTPSAAVPSPLFFGPGHITMRNTVTHNLFFVICSFFVILAAMPIASAFL